MVFITNNKFGMSFGSLGDPDRFHLTLYWQAQHIDNTGKWTTQGETYQTVKGKLTSSSTELGDEDCEKIEEVLKHELKKRWYSIKDMILIGYFKTNK